MNGRIYLEGGGNTKESRSRCREGFRKLLENCGFTGRMPKLVACGSRSAAFDDFKTAHSQWACGEYVGLLVDSEDPVTNTDQPWQHVAQRVGDQWVKPPDAVDEQLLLMTTSMETWIATDRATLHASFGSGFNESALPPLQQIELRNRQTAFDALRNASADCPGPYTKGRRSFELLGRLNPQVLEQHLPSFRRARRILDQGI